MGDVAEEMLGVYLSGTGNTKHCVEKLTGYLDADAKTIPLEDSDVIEQIKNNDTILFGYPIQFSNVPYMVQNFIKKNYILWEKKKILCIATMGAFSGDGAGCAARLFKRYGALVLGGIHIKMPDAVCDSKLLKKGIEQNREIIRQADKKIEDIAEQIRQGTYPREGLSLFAHMVGLFGQRLWFYRKTAGYTDKLKISDVCTECGLCVALCPMQNILLKDGRVIADNKCTMCYRCISRCPQKAITLLGDAVVEQCRYDRYVSTEVDG